MGELVYIFCLLYTLTLDEVLNLVTESDPEEEINWNISDESEYGEDIDCELVWEQMDRHDRVEEYSYFGGTISTLECGKINSFLFGL